MGFVSGFFNTLTYCAAASLDNHQNRQQSARKLCHHSKQQAQTSDALMTGCS